MEVIIYLNFKVILLFKFECVYGNLINYKITLINHN